MKEYKVICYAKQEIYVDAENEQQAEELAVNECVFAEIEYSEVEESQ